MSLTKLAVHLKVKHMAGKHPQKTHAGSRGSGGANSSSMPQQAYTRAVSPNRLSPERKAGYEQRIAKSVSELASDVEVKKVTKRPGSSILNIGIGDVVEVKAGPLKGMPVKLEGFTKKGGFERSGETAWKVSTLINRDAAAKQIGPNKPDYLQRPDFLDQDFEFAVSESELLG